MVRRRPAAPLVPSGRSRGRKLVIVGFSIVGVLLILLVTGLVALRFLGGQVEKTTAGTVEFGSGGTGCRVTGQATTFRVGQPIHTVAHLTRIVPAGETLTVHVMANGSAVQSHHQSIPTATECISIVDITTSREPPGTYRLEYLSGTETLSSGSFTLIP
jgi:hypothetical protein